MAGFATGFFEKADALDDDAAVDGFAHVVDGQRSGGDGDEGFHFYAGFAGERGDSFNFDTDALFAFIGLEAGEIKIDRDAFNGERMAEGNQIARAFGGHDAGDAGNRKHFALGDALFSDGAKCFGEEQDVAFCDGAAGGDVLGADINHVGLAGFIEVREFGAGGHGDILVILVGCAISFEVGKVIGETRVRPESLTHGTGCF